MYKGLNPKLSARSYYNLQVQIARSKAILQHQTNFLSDDDNEQEEGFEGVVFGRD